MKISCKYCYNHHICHAQTPTIYGLSMLRDAPNIPISQSKIDVALFGATYSFEPIVPDKSILHKDEIW